MHSTLSRSRLVLASSSPYRQALLHRLGQPFEVDVPDIDEREAPGETCSALVLRLALSKATVVHARHSDAFVIGSDQVVDLNDRPLSKPGSKDNARAQLVALSGRALIFHTGVAVIAPGGAARVVDIETRVGFRDLSAADIEHYLDIEQPYDCAGAFKSEQLGIALVKRIQSDDPTALIGLPLIAVVDLLSALGYPSLLLPMPP